MEAYTGGISTRKVDALVEALGGASGISKSEVSRICLGLDEQVKAFLGRPLDHPRFPYIYLDATYLHGRLRPEPAGGVTGRGGDDRHQCPRLPRSAPHRRGRQ